MNLTKFYALDTNGNIRYSSSDLTKVIRWTRRGRRRFCKFAVVSW